jgi:ubiquinone/menaquinone biosynthesis C-methylase UbiE
MDADAIAGGVVDLDASRVEEIEALRFGLVLLIGLTLYEVLSRVLKKRAPGPASPIVGLFLDSALRKALQPPDRVIQRSGIAKGMTVLEIGSGSGAFTTLATRAVGSSGIVYTLDVQSGMLAQLQRKLSRKEHRGIHNLSLTHASATELPFAGTRFDLAYLVTVLQEIPDRSRALGECWRVLRPGGQIAVTELLLDPDYVPPHTTVRQLEGAGFAGTQVSGNLWDYTVTARKPAPPAAERERAGRRVDGS